MRMHHRPVWLLPLGAMASCVRFQKGLSIRIEPMKIGKAVRFLLRIDVLDDSGWGSTPDVVYVKPSPRVNPFGNSQHKITIDLSVIDSTALFAATPPGRAHRPGDELDAEVRHGLELGFDARLSSYCSASA